MSTGGKASIASALAAARKRLQTAGIDDPLLDARLLIAEVVGFSLTDFVMKPDRPVTAEENARIAAMIERRALGEPVHRILGHREFHGLDLLLSKETLEPRPDTEVLVDTLLPALKETVSRTGSVRILDLGTGTGAICLALLKECTQASGIGSDISADALETAARNAARNGLSSRFETIRSDWFEKISGRFDIIVSNPPYIRTDIVATLDREVRNHDPMAALDGGQDGLAPYRLIAADAGRFLVENGIVGVEIGFDQRLDVSAIFASHGFSLLDAVKDYGGNDRVLTFRR
ncbi:peptide chain release factor N(5)-glutamine methyltransferase [Agrobacterium salinitolerans]|uniref:Release factor glutamine methyltransferase n=1 Tax=Agrobacterium salinitolerans TaxID=1183413 RepID=A0ABY3BMV4_9HYPH|nr:MULTISPECIES: peptide chain release factor N(5)-glutamine methyltransferase [Agrobacterium]MCZ7854806.1 peptide chain release factor N(5)-glutamine methyltransferase [Agrobacterium salinitolerans]MCZ7893507.1 peptide chain release factor N(5)-glutamine methyltransferase [Agrobacterium salinitolerans]MCZ7973314.1 peptide chain release factor N(5)-glutamine methyltransferase [Agrobacterium salinitolerans]TRA88602.1 peptide chain release factor N(5)-glutamine methyltransferase [Agrobacterium sa